MSRTYKKDDIIAAIQDSKGVITNVTNALGANFTSWYYWVKKWPELDDLLEQAHQRTLKTIENVVLTAAEGGDLPTARWVLDRRDPRYSTKQSVAVTVSADQKTPFDDKGKLTDEAIAALRLLSGLATVEEDDGKTEEEKS